MNSRKGDFTTIHDRCQHLNTWGIKFISKPLETDIDIVKIVTSNSDQTGHQLEECFLSYFQERLEIFRPYVEI